jgi:hypothetical protein
MARTKTTNADQLLLRALVCGATVENAARKAGMGERTAYRRLADPKFQAELKKASQEIFQRSAAMLSSANIGCIKTLVELHQDVAVQPNVRRGAARDVMELTLKFRDRADLELRLAALEEHVAGIVAGNSPSGDNQDPTQAPAIRSPS